jgi:type I restriction enzyme S subunit
MKANGPVVWVHSTLGTACRINPPKPKLNELSDDLPVLFVPMAAVDEVTGTISEAHSRPLGEVRRRSYRTFEPNDILFAKITPCMENGKAAIVPDVPSGLGFGSTEFHVLRPAENVNGRYIWHFVRREQFRRMAERHMTGSVGQARVPVSFMEEFPIDLPPPDVQSRIVRLLDHTSDLADSVSDRLGAARRNLATFRRALLASACSGRLTAEYRRGHREDAERALSEHISRNAHVRVNERRTKPAPGLAIPDLSGSFPKEWAYWPVRELVRHRAIIDLQDGNHGELYPRKHDFGQEGVPFISAENVDEEVRFARAPRLKAEVAQQLRLGFARGGDVILTHNATVGRVALVPQDAPELVLSTSTTYYRLDGSILDPQYLLIYMRSPYFQHQLSAVMEQTTRNQVPVTKQVELRVAVPPVGEQHEIVRRVKSLSVVTDELIGRIDATGRHVSQMKDAVVNNAFRSGPST